MVRRRPNDKRSPSGARVRSRSGPPRAPDARAGAAARARFDVLRFALAFFAIYVVWGSTYLAIRYAVEAIPPLTTAGLRHLVAGGILFAVAHGRGQRQQNEKIGHLRGRVLLYRMTGWMYHFSR